ncbi:MAG: hypothetical protein JNJ40_10280 [Bacteroidia bacterium]|nr:hypothetical protein [Bacteroidia bacterium]
METTIKTTMISTSNATHESVLQILEENKITYVELGKDQKGNTVLQVSYTDKQQLVIDDLQLLINFIEDAVDLFMPITIKFLKAFGHEAEIALKTLQEKYADKKLSSNDLKQNTSKQKTNGNEKGK